jgi:hypothetical protein
MIYDLVATSRYRYRYFAASLAHLFPQISRRKAGLESTSQQHIALLGHRERFLPVNSMASSESIVSH